MPVERVLVGGVVCGGGERGDDVGRLDRGLRHRIECEEVGGLPSEANRPLVHLLHRVEQLEEGTEHRPLHSRGAQLLEGSEDVVCPERTAVVPAHALAEVEGIDPAVLGDLPATGERRHDPIVGIVVGVAPDEGLVDEMEVDPHRQTVVGNQRVERGGLVVGAEDRLAALLRVAREGRRRQAALTPRRR